MIAPSTAGFTCGHSDPSSAFVTEMKSCPKYTPETPGTANREEARGERAAAWASRASKVDSGITTRPGRNFRVAGFGVASV